MIFYRFGEIPEDECSSIWNNNEVIGKEKGVSVYEWNILSSSSISNK